MKEKVCQDRWHNHDTISIDSKSSYFLCSSRGGQSNYSYSIFSHLRLDSPRFFCFFDKVRFVHPTLSTQERDIIYNYTYIKYDEKF
jgi:hypothetical protein